MPKITEKNAFWLKDGENSLISVCYSLNELYSNLKKSKMSAVKFHMNAEKNDFAEWTENTLKKKDLAKKMRRIDPSSRSRKSEILGLIK